jgi:hypothetical protein
MEFKIKEFLENNLYTKKTSLCDIMTKYGSDKGSRHNYTTLYNHLFLDIKNDNLNIFEVGLGTNNPNIKSSMGVNGKPGASLRGWREYFKQSNIFGADVDRNILFTEDKIHTFFVDQMNVNSITELLENDFLKNLEFDLIIDDGLHEFEANINFLEKSIQKLKDKGFYIVEDISEVYVSDFKDYINLNKNKYNYITMMTIPINTDVQENNRLLIIKK